MLGTQFPPLHLNLEKSSPGLTKDILFVHIKTLPLFIGAVSSAYEGVGTIIPIESSMQVRLC